MTSLSSSSLHLFSSHSLRQSLSPKTHLLPSKPLLFSSPISFQRLPKSSPLQPIRAQRQSPEPELDIDLSLLPPKLRDIVTLFQSVPDSSAKYKQLLHYGSQLPPLDPKYKTDENRVRGCVSQVWVRAFRAGDDPDAVCFEADSDAALVKGLAALLVFGLSGSPASVIARVPPEFIHITGLRQSLSPSRNSGFLNMITLMQQKALQLDAQVADPGDDGVSGLGGSNSDARGGVLEEKGSILIEEADGISKGEVLGVNGSGNSRNDPVSLREESLDVNGADVVSSAHSGGGSGGRRERIREKLESRLSPVELEVEDISYLHAGHAGVRGNSGGETHFNVRIVSKEFEGKSLVKRHRLVYDLLQEELQSGLHALSIDAKTPSEVQSS